MENNVLDLSSVKIPTGTIKLPGGKSIEVTAPSLESLINMMVMLKEWQKKSIGKKNADSDETIEQIQDFIKKVKTFIPALKDHDLPIELLVTIVQFVASLAKPADLKELERRGITINNKSGNKKKV